MCRRRGLEVHTQKCWEEQVARRILCILTGFSKNLCFPGQYDPSVLCWSLFQEKVRSSLQKVVIKKKLQGNNELQGNTIIKSETSCLQRIRKIPWL